MIKETYSVEAEYLWDGETHAVFRHPVSNKWFGIIMEVKKKNLHIKGCEKSCETEDVMNVKVNPILIEDLLIKLGFRVFSSYIITNLSNDKIHLKYAIIYSISI